MTEAYNDYPDDPERLAINGRLRAVHDHAGFYPDTRTELTEALTIIDDFSMGGLWKHLEFEVRTHQDKATKREKTSDAAIAVIVAGYRDSAESAVNAYYALDSVHLKIAEAYTDSLNPKLSLAAIDDEETKQGLILATRYRDLKLFAVQGRELGFNPLDKDYFEEGAEPWTAERVTEAFAKKSLLEIDDDVMEAREDQLTRAKFHTDVLKMCRRFKARKAAGIAASTVAEMFQIFPVPMDRDEFSHPAAHRVSTKL